MKFEETGEITIDRGEHYNVITINNYSKYQDDGQTCSISDALSGTSCSISDALSGTSCSISDALSGTDRRTIRNKNKKNKNISCSSHDERYSDSHSEFDFESFWAKYPRKQNRLKAPFVN